MNPVSGNAPARFKIKRQSLRPRYANNKPGTVRTSMRYQGFRVSIRDRVGSPIWREHLKEICDPQHFLWWSYSFHAGVFIHACELEGLKIVGDARVKQRILCQRIEDADHFLAKFRSQTGLLGIIPSGGFRHVAFDFRANDYMPVHFWERRRLFISSSGMDEAGS